MSYIIKIKVNQSTNKDLKYYIYRSKNSIDINTISKVKSLLPIIVFDEKSYDTSQMENDSYILYDNLEKSLEQSGVTYLGPEPVSIPATEYETTLKNIAFNQRTNAITVTLDPLPIEYKGIMYYYSVIGVNDNDKTITHLSKVSAEVLLSDYNKDGTRELLYCNNYTGFPDDEWTHIANPDWNTDIVFGDVNNPITYNRYGSPFVDDVAIFKTDDIEYDTRCALLFGHITIRIPNIWRGNNKKYNHRKLKSFKIRNICNDKYGDFSEPTFQSELPVSNERLLIFKQNVSELPIEEANNPINKDDKDLLSMTIIRKNGLYYNEEDHKYLGTNRFNIQEKEKLAIFNEASAQKEITIDFDVDGGALYNFTYYIQDVYGKYSKPIAILIRT